MEGGGGVFPDVAGGDGEEDDVGAFGFGFGGHFGHVPGVIVGVVWGAADVDFLGFIAGGVGGGAVVDAEDDECEVAGFDLGEDFGPVAVVVGE